MMMIGIGIPMTQSSIERMNFPWSVRVLNGRPPGKFPTASHQAHALLGALEGAVHLGALLV